MRLISNEVENYGNTPVEWWLTAFYTGRNVEKLAPDGVLYRFHLSHNDLDGLACHVVSTIYDCILNCFEIPMVMVDATEALQYKDWDQIHNAHNRMPIRHSICEAGAKNVKEKLHQIFEACCRSVYHKPVGPNDQIILLITDLGGLTDSMFDEFYEKFGDRFQVIVVDHHLTTTVPERGKCDPNQIFWYVTGYQEGNLQSATKNLFTATYGSYDAAHATSKKQEKFVKQLTEYVEAVSKYDTGRWGEWLDRKTPDDVDLSVQHQLFFNNIPWDSSADIFHRVLISKYVQDMIYLLSTEDYVHTNRAYWEIVRGNLNELHKEFYDMRQLTLAYNPLVTFTLKIDPINGVYNPATRHTIRFGDINADVHVQPVNNRLHPLVTFGIIELRKDQSQTKEWKYFSLCSREIMAKYKLDLFILVDEPKGTVSLRSMNNHGFEINCADIARRNGGGGHKRAAGYPIPKVVEVLEDHPERYSQLPGVIPYSVTMQKRTETLLYNEADVDIEEDEDDTDADDWEDDTEDDGTDDDDADDSSNDSEEEVSDEELILDAYPPIGTNVHWAGHNWIVSHVTSAEVYLTLNGIDGNSTWDNLQNACTTFANSLTEKQKACLKSVTAGNTSGKVFVATRDLMDGGFSYFRSNSHRRLNSVYWTSTEYSSDNAWSVITDGSLNTTYTYFHHVAKSDSYGFRPSVCVDLTRHNSCDSKGSDEPKLNPELPDMSSLTIGNTVTFADKEWVVSHKTDDIFYLTLNGVLSDSTWDDLQNACTNFENSLTETQKACLKNITAGNTSGKVFVATKDQMDGGFDYFNSDSQRNVGSVYWTSSEIDSFDAWGVDSDGYLGKYSYGKSNSIGFRPSIAISTKEVCNDHDISDESDDSEKEDSDEELIPIVDRNRVIRWAGINWKPLQQDDDLLFLTPCEPVDDVKLCTFRELGDVAAEWGAKHLSKTNQSMLVPIYPYGITCTIAPISLEHILNIPDARNANRAQISMPYGNVPYWTGSSAYNGGDTDDMVWCMNEKGQNVPVNKDAFLAFRPMICLHITDALVNSLDDGKSTVLMPNIPNAYPSIGKHVYWAGNDWIVTHVDQKMVYMTLADVVPDWKVAWDELQDTCYAWAKKTFSVEEMKKLVPVACGNTHGKVWVASKQLIGTGLAYFADNEHRAVNSPYWTSTERHSHDAWVVSSGGVLYYSIGNKTIKYGFRPSICMPRSNFGPVHSVDDRSEEVELYKSCRTLIATGMRVMWANQEWIVSDIKPYIIALTLAHAASNPIDWNDLQNACDAWASENLTEAQRAKLLHIGSGDVCGKVFVVAKYQMLGGLAYFKNDDSRYLGECYWTSTRDANGTTYYVDETGKIQSVSGQEMCSDTAPKFALRPTVVMWSEEFCNDRDVTVVGE